MDAIAKASGAERAELFRQSAVELKPERSPAIIEKDFWVCWTLRRIFEVVRYRPQLIFKGGTSLSKAYQAIERFSEDVDLSLSRRDLGFADSQDPEQPGIKGNEVRRRLENLKKACESEIRERFLPRLYEDFSGVLGESGWSLTLDEADPQTVLFSFPKSGLEEEPRSYIRPVVRLEMGARSDDWPAEEREIRSYAAESFPQVFRVAVSCHVHTLDAVRTFWEKATLLHAEYHRPPEKRTRERLSRHYYDLYRLSGTEIGQRALVRRDLLERVVHHKQMFFASAWAHYETARPSSFHLVPPKDRIADFRADYAHTQEMIFGERPLWDGIMAGLRELEDRINAMAIEPVKLSDFKASM